METPTDTSQKPRQESEFNKVIDATSEFVKAVFPYGKTLVEKLKGKRDSRKANESTEANHD